MEIFPHEQGTIFKVMTPGCPCHSQGSQTYSHDGFPSNLIRTLRQGLRKHLCSPYLPARGGCYSLCLKRRADTGPPCSQDFYLLDRPSSPRAVGHPCHLDQRQNSVPLYVVSVDGKRAGQKEAPGRPVAQVHTWASLVLTTAHTWPLYTEAGGRWATPLRKGVPKKCM